MLLRKILTFIGIVLALTTNIVYGQVIEDGLISYWTFDKDDIDGIVVKDIVGEQHAQMQGSSQIVEGKVGNAIELNGSTDWLLVNDDINTMKLPTREITCEVWVSPEEFDAWGTFLGVFQDNGGFEKGWILGTVHNEEGAGANEFSFAISSEDADDGDGDLTYFHSGPYEIGNWYHVAGVYDGIKTKIYVNGELVVDSEGQSGDIVYPDNGFFVIGVYKDDNEHDPFKGKLDEIRLYDKALTEENVLQNMNSEGMALDAFAKLSISWGEIKIADSLTN